MGQLYWIALYNELCSKSLIISRFPQSSEAFEREKAFNLSNLQSSYCEWSSSCRHFWPSCVQEVRKYFYFLHFLQWPIFAVFNLFMGFIRFGLYQIWNFWRFLVEITVLKNCTKNCLIIKVFFPSKTAFFRRKKFFFGLRKKKRVEKRNALATRFFFRQIFRF